MDLFFAVHKLSKFSSNPGRVQFKSLVRLLRYIRANTNLGLKYYAKIEYALLSDLLRQVGINTDNQLMVLSYYILQYFKDTVISTVPYTVFYQGGPIDHCAYVIGPFSQSSA